MDNSISNFELSESTVRLGSDSEKSSEKSDNFEELVEPDTDESSNGTNENKVKLHSEDFDNNLPETVTLLKHPETGVKVYLVGTAHFSKESQDDVIKVIRNVQPQIIVLELCDARTSILSLDEATILEEAKNIDFDKVRSTIRTNGFYNGVMYLLLLNMSAHITKEIGMAPGGEFRVAYKEARTLPSCSIHLGDRPIQITLKRALSRLSWFQTIKLGWHLLTNKEPISKEEIEKCKRRDMLEQLLADMAGEYPALGEVFVDERDIYLTHSLQMVSGPRLHKHQEPPTVVGVVGMGHVVGITRLWLKDQRPFLANILTIPPPSLSSKIFRITFRLSLLTLGGFVVYRFVPMPKMFRETCRTGFERIVSNIKKF
ncbi:traB domain-containing protein isoform X2 [Photinus pyralis]|uniref:traB domain-containing protein isoform X2 n=1 Tax=Photinus pyralis TaxID=7054 RepID=UPI00126727CF|nr:traB domain-containing protein isoform X2 [Photinus pyralis]